MASRVCLKKKMIQEFSGMLQSYIFTQNTYVAFLLRIYFSATSPGKLLQYLVEDGCHINAKEPYAEIEVCTAYVIEHVFQ